MIQYLTQHIIQYMIYRIIWKECVVCTCCFCSTIEKVIHRVIINFHVSRNEGEWKQMF